MATQVMTDLEEIVYDYLVRRKIPFQFQTSLAGGFYELGGAVIDFLLPDRQLAWRIMGEYWHRGVEKSGSDLIQKEMLENEGWTVVDLQEQDIRDRLEQTMRLALLGQEMLQ